MKTPFTIADGPLAGCSPANTLTVDSGLIGLEPAAGDTRFILRWRRATGTAVGLYKFVRGDDGKVMAVHVPGGDDVLLPTAEELRLARAAAAVVMVRRAAEEFPEVAGMLKEGV